MAIQPHLRNVESETDTANWVRPIGKSASPCAARLFCFPFAGGTASSFRDWATNLPNGIEVFALQLPGREDRLKESNLTQMTALVQTLEHVMYPLFDRPFAFFGHSLGAWVAFELARSLQCRGTVLPSLLITSGARAPHITNRDPLIHTLPDREFINELKRLAGTPSAIFEEPELLALLLPQIRADFTLYETYRYSDAPPLQTPIQVFWGSEDEDVTQTDAESWSVQTVQSFGLHHFPGGHFFIDSAKHEVLATLSSCLDSHLSREPKST